MAKCVDCALFPWEKGADVSMLPAMKCSPNRPARRWTAEGVTAEHDCPEFTPKEGAAQIATHADQRAPDQEVADEVVSTNDANIGTEDPAPEASKRANTRRKDRR